MRFVFLTSTKRGTSAKNCRTTFHHLSKYWKTTRNILALKHHLQRSSHDKTHLVFVHPCPVLAPACGCCHLPPYNLISKWAHWEWESYFQALSFFKQKLVLKQYTPVVTVFCLDTFSFFAFPMMEQPLNLFTFPNMISARREHFQEILCFQTSFVRPYGCFFKPIKITGMVSEIHQILQKIFARWETSKGSKKMPL